MMQKAIIYHTTLSEDPTLDDLDVLDEVKFVSGVLTNLGYKVEQKPFNLTKSANKGHLDETIRRELKETAPSFIFNLVEAIDEKDSLSYLAPFHFESFNIPYTGCTYDSFFKTHSKIGAKIFLKMYNIPTPYWLTLKNLSSRYSSRKKFIIKSQTEHASKGLEPILFETGAELKNSLRLKGGDFFAEEYIDGREFNVSMFGPIEKGEVLPIAEMKFRDWQLNKLKIVDYSAKWKESSEEYNKTERTFEFSESDKPLLKNIEEICKKCWKIFNLRGYARVDFRVDKEKKPYVLEINTNPCISPDAGFVAASHKAGMTDEQIIRNIIKNSCGEEFVL